MNLGRRIQDLRRRRELMTRELAARAQVTSSFISQLEHNKTSPSLDALQRIAAALQVPLTYLLLEENSSPQVVRKHERQVVHLEDSGLKASILSPLPQQDLELVLLELPPGEASWAKSRCHEGHECHLVLKGRIRAYHGDETYLLEEGDSILWDGMVPHRMENLGDQDAQLFIALTPSAFLPLERSGEEEEYGREVHETEAPQEAGRRTSRVQGRQAFQKVASRLSPAQQAHGASVKVDRHALRGVDR
jgi:transcriptional regulator with XRE-family HTH domain